MELHYRACDVRKEFKLIDGLNILVWGRPAI
jgi:hypothetical protein